MSPCSLSGACCSTRCARSSPTAGARATFPAGTTIAGQQTGALGFYACDLNVINVDGVVSRPALDAARQGDVLGYCRSRDVEYIVGWESNIRSMLDFSRPADHGFVERIGTVPGFRSWGEQWHIYRLTQSRP